MDARNEPAAGAAHELRITRIFEAPRRLVFRAWTDPEQMGRWAAPPGVQRVEGASDTRVGGAYSACMVSPDGQEHRVHGVYREIVEPEKLVMTHGWLDAQRRPGHMTLVTVTFEELGPKRTRMEFVQTGFDSLASRNGHEGGWNGSFDQLVALLAEEQRA